MIKIHQWTVDSLKEKMQKAMKSGKSVYMFYMDRVSIATILGLIEQYEAMTAGKEYQEGYAKGFYDAKAEAWRMIGRVELNERRDNTEKHAAGSAGNNPGRAADEQRKV